MVLEELLNKIGKRKFYAFILGMLYVFVSYGTAKIFFPVSISLTMVFFITLLLIPSTFKLVSVEERIERKYGTSNFLRRHSTIMEIFLFLFIGIFIGYLIIGSYSVEALEYQSGFLAEQGIVGDFIDEGIQKIPQFFSILANNTSVIVVAFILSLFYSVGALFLIVYNASIFSSFILRFTELVSQQKILSTALFSVHFIPEVFGFLLAAIAGGVISKAIVREKVGTNEFRNVVIRMFVSLSQCVCL